MIVVDASIAVKWVMPEPDSDAAGALLTQPLIAPDLWLVEAANALWRNAVTKSITELQALQALARLRVSPVTTLPSSDYLASALELATRLHHPIYDCLYLALALREDSYVMTADTRFAKAVAVEPKLLKRVQLLGALAD
jgi:predicted nucleic acid-binding protein